MQLAQNLLIDTKIGLASFRIDLNTSCLRNSDSVYERIMWKPDSEFSELEKKRWLLKQRKKRQQRVIDKHKASETILAQKRSDGVNEKKNTGREVLSQVENIVLRRKHFTPKFPPSRKVRHFLTQKRGFIVNTLTYQK